MWERRRGEKSEQFEVATYELNEYSGDHVRIGPHRDVGQPFEKANICKYVFGPLVSYFRRDFELSDCYSAASIVP